MTRVRQLRGMELFPARTDKSSGRPGVARLAVRRPPFEEGLCVAAGLQTALSVCSWCLLLRVTRRFVSTIVIRGGRGRPRGKYHRLAGSRRVGIEESDIPHRFKILMREYHPPSFARPD